MFWSTAMSKGYWIVRVSVRDEARYPDYLAAARAAFEKYGATFLVRGGPFDAMEGEARERNVVVEFKDRATALACYHSPEYQAARALRQKYADADFIIIEGAATDTAVSRDVARDRPDPEPPQPIADKPGLVSRMVDALMRSRRRHAELYLGHPLADLGGRLTDNVERRMMERTLPGQAFRF